MSQTVTLDNTLEALQELPPIETADDAERNRMVIEIYKARLIAEALNNVAESISNLSNSVSLRD